MATGAGQRQCPNDYCHGKQRLPVIPQEHGSLLRTTVHSIVGPFIPGVDNHLGRRAAAR